MHHLDYTQRQITNKVHTDMMTESLHGVAWMRVMVTTNIKYNLIVLKKNLDVKRIHEMIIL